jgi:Spy/CpxP family protein refolding chaperone
MKKIFLSAAIVTASVCAAYAQDQKATQPVPQVVKETDQKSYEAKQASEWEARLKTELKLTDEQLTKIAIANKEFTEKKEAILKDASLTEDARKEKKAALKKEKETKFFEILTPEQQTKYKQMTEEKMKQTKEAAKQ